MLFVWNSRAHVLRTQAMRHTFVSHEIKYCLDLESKFSEGKSITEYNTTKILCELIHTRVYAQRGHAICIDYKSSNSLIQGRYILQRPHLNTTREKLEKISLKQSL